MSDLTPLLETLRGLARAQDDLKAAALAKRDALTACRLSEIEQATAREEEALARLAPLESARAAALARLLPGERHPRLSLLLPQADGPERLELEALREHLRRGAGEVARVNRLNAQLSEQALTHFAGYVQVLAHSGLGSEQQVYTRKGAPSQFAASALVSRNA